MVVLEGATITELVVIIMGSQVKLVPAELAVSTAGDPSQTSVELADAITGSGSTVMLVTADPVPHAFWPVTVYALVAVGANDCPFTAPPVQL